MNTGDTEDTEWVKEGREGKERRQTHTEGGGRRDGSTVVLLVIPCTVCLGVNPTFSHPWTNSLLLWKKSQLSLIHI